MEFPGFSLEREEKDEARLRKHDLKLCVCLTGRVPVPDASTFFSQGKMHGEMLPNFYKMLTRE
jgi:hypothetical protein